MKRRHSSSGSNRRRARRQTPKRTSKIQCFRGSLGLGRNLAIAFKDLSEEGACVLMTEPLREKQDVQILFEAIDHRKPVQVLGHVQWMKPAEDGNYWVGLAFEKAIPWQDLQSLSRFSS